MNDDQDYQKALAKRLVTLSGMIVFVCALAFVTKLASFDAAVHRADLDALNLLDSSALQVGDRSEGSDESHYAEYSAWLQTEHNTLYDEGTQARQALVDDLIGLGVDEATLTSEMQSDADKFTTSDYPLSPDDRQFLSFEEWRFRIGRAPRVADRLDLLNALYAPRTAHAVKSVGKRAAEPKLPPELTRQEPQFRRGGSEPSLGVKRFRLDGDYVLVDLYIGSLYGRAGLLWQDVARYSVVVEAVEAPPIYKLIGGFSDDHAVLHDDLQRKRRLRAIYGLLPIDNAKAIASEHAIRTYRQIDIFGLTFSTQRFAMAVASFLLLIMLGICMTTRTANRRGLQIISGVAHESVLDVFLDSPWSRVVIFVIIPMGAIAASLPPFVLTTIEYTIIAILASGIAVLGFLTIKYTKKQ